MTQTHLLSNEVAQWQTGRAIALRTRLKRLRGSPLPTRPAGSKTSPEPRLSQRAESRDEARFLACLSTTRPLPESQTCAGSDPFRRGFSFQQLGRTVADGTVGTNPGNHCTGAPGARVSPLCRGFPVLAPSHTGRYTGQRRVLDRPLPRRPWPPFPRLCGRRTNFQTKHPVQAATNRRELP
jgi:hypothetical protein